MLEAKVETTVNKFTFTVATIDVIDADIDTDISVNLVIIITPKVSKDVDIVVITTAMPDTIANVIEVIPKVAASPNLVNAIIELFTSRVNDMSVVATIWIDIDSWAICPLIINILVPSIMIPF